MKSPILMSLAALIFSLPAHSAGLLLDMRLDADSVSYNQAAGGTNQMGFLLHTARLDLKGSMSESLSYRLRFRFNNENTVQGVDSLSSKIDHASVTHKMGAVALTIGKTVTDVGGHETIADSRDLYFKSEANKALTGTYNALSNNANPVFYQVKYDTGAKATVGLGESDLSLMVMNNPEAESTATPKAQNRLLQGIVWKGKFAGNTLQPVLSYHTFKSNLDRPTSVSETEAKLAAVGFKWADAGSFAQIDYVHLKADNVALPAPSDFEVNSLVLEGGYKMGAWTPRLKAEMSTVSELPDGGAKLKSNVEGYGIAFEYQVPEADLARYHLALTQKTVKPENQPNQTENHVIAGFVFAYDLLK